MKQPKGRILKDKIFSIGTIQENKCPTWNLSQALKLTTPSYSWGLSTRSWFSILTKWGQYLSSIHPHPVLMGCQLGHEDSLDS